MLPIEKYIDAIVNAKGSSIAREADMLIYTLAGPEISVASTKAYMKQNGAVLAKGWLMGLQFATMLENGDYFEKTIDRENTEEQVDFILEKLPGLVQRLRDMSPVYPGKKA